MLQQMPKQTNGDIFNMILGVIKNVIIGLALVVMEVAFQQYTTAAASSHLTHISLWKLRSNKKELPVMARITLL